MDKAISLSFSPRTLLHMSIAQMTPSQGRRSPCRRRNTVIMNEQRGSSSSEESSSGDETSSDITLHEIDEVNECLACPHRVEPVAEPPIPQYTVIDSPRIFPFHLISGCSSAGRRAVMCTLTSQQVKTAVLGLRGTSRCAGGTLRASRNSPATGALDPECAVIASCHRETFARDHARAFEPNSRPG